ncbi:MAG: 2Fe-2S iron-sulfur cluster-binding protein [bacterium]
MATIKNGNQQQTVPDGGKIDTACEELGVPFGCHDGMCMSCRIEITEGAENLSELSEQENALGMDRNNRLACQCKIKTGNVVFKY